MFAVFSVNCNLIVSHLYKIYAYYQFNVFLNYNDVNII